MSLFDNPVIKKMAFGKLKEYMQSEQIKAIVVTVNKDGELIFDPVKDDIVTMTRTEFENLQNIIKNGL